MGRFSMCRKRGGYVIEGQIVPFKHAEYQFRFNEAEQLVGWRAIPYPPTANRWQMRWRHLSPGTWNYSEVKEEEEILCLDDPPSGTYEGQAAWWNAQARISAWSESNEFEVP